MSDVLIFQTYIVQPRLVFSWSKTFSHLYSCLSKFIKFLSGSICIIDGSQPNRIHWIIHLVFSLVFFMKYRISELEKKKKEWNLYLSLIFYRVNQAMTVLVTIDYDRSPIGRYCQGSFPLQTYTMKFDDRNVQQ